jgi:lipopolysaccharide transport system permease protein
MPSTHRNLVIVEPPRRWTWIPCRELWNYRELLGCLAWRDLSVRYRQTLIGAAWAILQPAVTVAIFSLFFGKLAQMPSDGIPYPVFCLAALLPWQFFSSAATQASNSLVANAGLLTKVYFPRLLIPAASVLPPLVDFLLGFAVLLGVMIGGYGMMPTWNVLLVLPLLLVALVAAFGLGTWLAAVNVEYRDVRYAVPFLFQLGMFVSPVVYPASLVPESWRLWYGLNPLTGVIEGFRWALFGGATPPGPMIAMSTGAALVLLFGGVAYFQRVERTFADVV